MSIRSLSRRGFAAGGALVGATAAFGHFRRFAGAISATPAASPTAEQPVPNLLVRMETTGGRPPELDLIAPPDFSLYDDGSVYRLGPVIAIFPPPALPNITRALLSPEGVARIVERARVAGLDEAREFPNPTMNDQGPVVRFFFREGDELVETTVWGATWSSERPPDWDDETWSAFEAVREFVSATQALWGEVDEAEVLEPELPVDLDRLQVIAFEASPDLVLESGIPNLEAPPVAWPLATPLAEIATPIEQITDSALPALTCVELSGEDAAAVIAAARTGDLLSPWSSGDTLYGVLLKPLLPDQTGCV